MSRTLLSRCRGNVHRYNLSFIIRTTSCCNISYSCLLKHATSGANTVVTMRSVPRRSPSVRSGHLRGNDMLPALGGGLIIGSLRVVFSLLRRYGGGTLAARTSGYLVRIICVLFHQLCDTSTRGPRTVFSTTSCTCRTRTIDTVLQSTTGINRLTNNNDISNRSNIRTSQLPTVLPSSLATGCPRFTTSLLGLLHATRGGTNWCLYGGGLQRTEAYQEFCCICISNLASLTHDRSTDRTVATTTAAVPGRA